MGDLRRLLGTLQVGEIEGSHACDNKGCNGNYQGLLGTLKDKQFHGRQDREGVSFKKFLDGLGKQRERF